MAEIRFVLDCIAINILADNDVPIASTSDLVVPESRPLGMKFGDPSVNESFSFSVVAFEPDSGPLEIDASSKVSSHA